jgi:beta-glucosidase
MEQITSPASSSNRCTLLATVTLNAADQAFFNAKGGKIGIWTVAASNALFDDFGGGTVTP